MIVFCQAGKIGDVGEMLANIGKPLLAQSITLRQGHWPALAPGGIVGPTIHVLYTDKRTVHG
jgi:hypothetical protein